MKIGRHRRPPFAASSPVHGRIGARSTPPLAWSPSPFSSSRDAHKGAPRVEFSPNQHQNA